MNPNIYIYDLEVLKDDWIAVFKRPDPKASHIVIHNDNYRLKTFLFSDPNMVFGGFNNKRYDDYVMLTMLLGGSNIEVKKCNDHIIGGGNGWEFPFLQYKKKPFHSFDLRDDIADQGLSLKAIEGNMNKEIVESSIPFDIDRPLTEDELDELIYYCKNDVDATIELYNERKDYLTSKMTVGRMYGIPDYEALGLTNAKLSAKVLKAKMATHDDERDYEMPDCLDPELMPDKVLDFFMQIRDKSIPDAKLFGSGKGSKGMTLDVWIKTAAGECPVTYAWGGVHGAKPAFTAEATKERLIVNWDVASLYPNSMINFGYCSRSMEDPNAYEKLVKTRLKAKKAGDVEKANALKLVVNTVYGAMLNQYNDLADRKAGRSVCISNQLAMTELVVMLSRKLHTIDFININTDGIMFFIDKIEDDTATYIVNQWCQITGFEMERDDFSKVIQKDVNNYIGIKTNGKMKTKGGYVSLYNGGSFKMNSLSIVHKAVVDFLLDGTTPEATIYAEKDIFKFQNIVKTGGTYEGSYQYVNDKLVPLQKVNRIYAVKDESYGQIVKRKWVTEKRKKDKTTGKMVPYPVEPHWEYTTISECPKHAYVDNENNLTVDDIDRDYYVRMAKDRIDKYTNINTTVKRKLNKITEVITIMPTNAPKQEEFKNVYEKLAEARVRFLEAPIKKSGKNTYAAFKYFELEDIVPTATKIFRDLGLVFLIAFQHDDEAYEATGTLVNTDDPQDIIVFTSPMETLTTNEGKYPNGMNSIQALGGTQTYLRRYLYYLVLDVVESDALDAVSGKPITTKKNNRPASDAQRADAKTELTNKEGNATDIQLKAIKNGLKKLRDKDGEKYEGYVRKTVGKMKSGLKKSEAENLLIEIGNKIEE